MRKGQIEIVGLVIIVIILIFSALIFLRLYFASSPSGSDDNLLLVQKANNMVNAIKGVEVCNSNMAQAIISCCNSEVFCGREACDFVLDQTAKIVNLTMSGEIINIEVKDRDGKSCFSYAKGRCNGGYVASSPSLIKESGGEAEIYLSLCTK